MAIVPLQGRVRPARGKGPARQARRDGEIPGVMYGSGETPVALAVPRREFDLAMKTAKGSNVIVGLALDGGAAQTAIIREVQRDPISHEILHLDFHHISLTETVKVEVVVHLVGVPDGVKNGGGVLEHISRTIEIECLPTEIPGHLEADVSALGIGDSIHVQRPGRRQGHGADGSRRDDRDGGAADEGRRDDAGRGGREGRARGDRQGQADRRSRGGQEVATAWRSS